MKKNNTSQNMVSLFFIGIVSALTLVYISSNVHPYFSLIALSPLFYIMYKIKFRLVNLFILLLAFNLVVVLVSFDGITDLDNLTTTEMILLSLFVAAQYAILALLLNFVERLTQKAIVFAPFIWIGFETIAGSFQLWQNYSNPLYLGYWALDTPIDQLGSISGIVGVSLALLLINYTVFLVFIKKFLIAFTLSITIVFAVVMLNIFTTPSSSQETLTVAAIQAAYTHPERHEAFRNNNIFTSHYERFNILTKAALNRQAQLILWAEVAAPGYTYYGLEEPLLQQAVKDAPAAVIGTVYKKYFGKYSSALVFNNGILNDIYSKRILLPRGESSWLTPGEHPVSVKLDGVEIGILICRDLSSPEIVREAAKGGENGLAILVHPDSFYGRGVDILHRATRFRAIETGRNIVFASEMGRSAIFSNTGAVLDESGWRKPEAWVRELPISSKETMYLRWGNWLGWTTIWFLGFIILLVFVRKRIVQKKSL